MGRLFTFVENILHVCGEAHQKLLSGRWSYATSATSHFYIFPHTHIS